MIELLIIVLAIIFFIFLIRKYPNFWLFTSAGYDSNLFMEKPPEILKYPYKMELGCEDCGEKFWTFVINNEKDKDEFPSKLRKCVNLSDEMCTCLKCVRCDNINDIGYMRNINNWKKGF